MSTKHTSFIPMAPGLRPQQRLYEVVTLPDIPKGLAPKIEMDQPLLKNPPKASPQKLTYLFSVEWAWSPMHNRNDNYYINPRRTGWLLWNNWLEDGGYPWTSGTSPQSDHTGRSIKSPSWKTFLRRRGSTSWWKA